MGSTKLVQVSTIGGFTGFSYSTPTQLPLIFCAEFNFERIFRFRSIFKGTRHFFVCGMDPKRLHGSLIWAPNLYTARPPASGTTNSFQNSCAKTLSNGIKTNLARPKRALELFFDKKVTKDLG